MTNSAHPSSDTPGRPAGHNLDVHHHMLAEALSGQDNRTKRLHALIRNEPAQAARSARTHLATDVVRWHNMLLVFAAKPSATESNLLISAVAEILRQNAVDHVFSIPDLARIARFSTDVWLDGSHRTQVGLRLRAAVVLGEILDDADRRPTIEAALRVLGVTNLPAPQSSETIGAMREQWTHDLMAAVEEKQAFCFSEADCATAQALAEDGPTRWLTEADWRAAARWADQPGQAIKELMLRAQISLIDAVTAPVLGTEITLNAPENSSSRPRP